MQGCGGLGAAFIFRSKYIVNSEREVLMNREYLTGLLADNYTDKWLWGGGTVGCPDNRKNEERESFGKLWLQGLLAK